MKVLSVTTFIIYSKYGASECLIPVSVIIIIIAYFKLYACTLNHYYNSTQLQIAMTNHHH